MAPSGRQRTFELVPNAPILGQQHPDDNAQPIYSKPPMTTKQAKKLHNQKNKGPKLSKAEQRRIELMEQDRIRKEFEKEKAQARARTAREKKKAKEEKEKEERKRKGLPLVDIHPSQDTISRFVSRVGGLIGVKRDSVEINTLDSVKEDPETVTDAGESDNEAGDEEEHVSDKENQGPVEGPESHREAKRRRLSQPDEKLVARMSPVASQLRAGPVAKIAHQLERESYSRASSVDTDDPINQTLLEEQIFADVEQASSRKDQAMDEKCQAVSATEQHPPDPVPQLSAPASSKPKEPGEPHPGPTRLQAPQRNTNSIGYDLAKTGATSYAKLNLSNRSFKKPPPPYVPAPRPTHSHTPPAFQMPDAPPKFKPPAVLSNLSVERPRFRPKHLNTSQRRHPSPTHQPPVPASDHTLPTSTQAFLLDYADEIFPSPTQEARELFEDPVAESPKPKVNSPRLSINGPTFRSEVATKEASAIAPHIRPGSRLPAPAPPTLAAENFFDSSFISTQDFMISTQDMLEIDTPSKAPTVSAAPQEPINREHPAPAPHARETEKSAVRVSAHPDTVQGCSQQPRMSPDEDKVDVDPSVAVASRSSGNRLDSRQSQDRRSSCTATRKCSSPRVTQCEQSNQVTASSRSLRSSYQRHTVVAQRCSTSDANNANQNTAQVLEVLTNPDRPRPKKRMFGSSGPGPEGLVAMERSYQEMRRQERAREARIRAQEKLGNPPAPLMQESDLNIAGFADDFSDDDFMESIVGLSSRRPSGTVQRDPDIQPCSLAQHATNVSASQETDYGDIDGDDLDFLKGDLSWLDEDLDDI
ncbi:hypothetical protein N0V93_005940 [Gnomoniopsis smithogilvyi]|uniref:Uncharacterized protein n=1 Tax=Gnomoniopsis smithogilvyi TaxID=1191159 RepID=A0A9W9CYH4_9PEZI|nr:hypothetical protein N0V93_005940 [Gnomoniopsis smithogilvyi]